MVKIHETAHNIGMPSNAPYFMDTLKATLIELTMNRLKRHDKTGGFNTFIPLKFRNGTIKCQIYLKSLL